MNVFSLHYFLKIFVIFFACCFLLPYPDLIAQTFERHYDYQGEYNSGYSIARTDYGYITLSNTKDQVDNVYDFMLMGLDEEGNELFQKPYSLDTTDFGALQYHNIKALRDGNFISTLIVQPPFPAIPRQHIALVKFNAQGDTLWTRFYDLNPSGDYGLNGLSVSANGDILMCGSQFNISNDILSRGLIMSVDSEGNYQWHRSNLGSGFFTELRDIKVSGDRVYAVGAHQANFSDFDGTSQYVVAMSTDGELLWQRVIPKSGPTGMDWPAEACAVQDNGNLLVAAGRSTGDWQNSSNKPMLMELNKNNGQTVWMEVYEPFYTFGDSYHEYFNQIRESPDGYYWLSGRASVGETWQEAAEVPFITKVSLEGDSIWKRRIVSVYLDSNGATYPLTSIVDFVFNDDGGITGIGELRSYTGDGPQNGWIQDTYVVRLDDQGCLVPGCETLVGVAELSATGLAMDLYPNPASDLLNVHVESVHRHSRYVLSVLDMQGRLLHAMTGSFPSSTYQIDVRDLAAGTYILSLENEKGQSEHRRFVVQD